MRFSDVRRIATRLDDIRRARQGVTLPFSVLPAPAAVRLAYNVLLQREPDPDGMAHFLGRLAAGLSREQMLDTMRWSEECRTDVVPTHLSTSLHVSRCDFVRSLPRARRILDLGGTHQDDREGMFVHLGYPYRFDRLVIVDLPAEERHELYRRSGDVERVETRLGPVEYAYHSMVDLSRYDDASFDLVYSGQTIEHVTEDECEAVLAEVMRVLRPGGWFCLDTPNAEVCRLHSPEQLINPDHKVEYTHAELSAKLTTGAGFELRDAKGLNYLGHRVDDGGFDERVVAGYRGMYGEPRDCYLLAYVARKPEEVRSGASRQ